MLGDIMEKDCTVLVIFSVPEILTNTDLEGKAFILFKTSADSYVLLKPNLDKICDSLRFFIVFTRNFSLFSTAS